MDYNFVTNIAGCIPSAISLMNGNLNLLYYSHIPVIIVSILIGFFVIFKNHKIISARVMFFLSIIFSIWIFSNLVVWLSSNSSVIMFFWSLFGILDVLLFTTSLYLVYTYELNQDLNNKLKILISVLAIPIIFLTPTTYNILSFDYDYCTANDNLFLGYIFIFKALITFGIVFVGVYRFIKSPMESRKQVLFMSIATLLFLLSIFGTGYLSDTLEIYTIEVYGIFVMTFFMAFLAYLIVKFKAFNIKLIGAQALVWALVILIGSQFFYLHDSELYVKVITGVTLIISGVLGLILVRGVKKEISLREQLQVANEGQKNLIHIMNHQIKGYMTIDRNIFAELLTDDYGKIPKSAKEIIQKGLSSADRGTAYVIDILRGAAAESGEIAFDIKDIDFKNTVLNKIESLKDRIEKKGLELCIDIKDADYYISGDETQLGEAIRNLIENSLNYTMKGSINIDMNKTKENIVFSIRDTGIGIKESDVHKIFKAGGVGDDSMKVNVNSSGYGLAFVKGVIEKHKGKVWFWSEGKNKGTTFFVELPIK